MKRICLILLSLTLVLSLLAGCDQSVATTLPTIPTSTTRPSVDPAIDRALFAGSGSYDSLVKTIRETIQNGRYQNSMMYRTVGGPQRSAADATEGAKAAYSGNFSTTNLQVAGVDEADIVKTDGRYLYYVANNRLYIVDMKEDTPKVVHTRFFNPSVQTGDKTSGENPVELFLDIQNKRLVVIVNGFLYENPPPQPEPTETKPVETKPTETRPEETKPVETKPEESKPGESTPAETAPDETGLSAPALVAPASRMMMPYYNHKSYTITRIFSLENPESPKLVRQFTQEGGYMTARMMSGSLYVFSSKNQYMYRYFSSDMVTDDNGELKPEEILPKTTEDPVNGTWSILPPDRIGIVPGADPNAQIIISAIAVNEDAKKPELLSLLGASGVVYASMDNIYIANYAYDYNEKEPEKSTSNMKIYRVGIQDGRITANGIGTVPGTIINQFAMDEHEGYFRIATTDSGAFWGRQDNRASSSTVYVLDKNLKTVGQVGKLGPGETIRSVRFMGDQAYVVTFRTTDPLYVLDLKSPTAPRVLGELKIPGFSTYLHPYGENLLLGFGFDAVVEGENAYQTSLKVSLFDISDLANPKERSTILLGGMGSHTELAYNHKALLFDKERNLIGFPATLTGENSSRTKEGGMLFQGLVLMTVENDTKLVLKGGLSNSSKFSSLKGNGIVYSQLSQADQMALYGYDAVTRGLYIGDRLITLSGRLIRQYHMDDLSRIGSVALKGFEQFYGVTSDLPVKEDG